MACLDVEGAVFEHLLKKKKVEKHGDESSDDDSSDDNSSDDDSSDADSEDSDDSSKEDKNDENENDNNENVLEDTEMPSSSSSTSITSSIEIPPPPTADDNNEENETDNLYVQRYGLVRVNNPKFKRARLSSPDVTKKPQLAKKVRKFADFSDSDSDDEITFK